MGIFNSKIFLPFVLCTVYSILAKPPSEIPGQEITNKQFLDFILPLDTIISKTPVKSPQSNNWFNDAERTWVAPSLAEQLNSDYESIKMGMGAVFIPYMSEDKILEPEIEIMDSLGKIVASGTTGRKYNLMPGIYYILMGSGVHKQKIVKSVTISEGSVLPMLADWCGISIDVVDTNNIPIRGEYELVRIDKFSPFGRGAGRSLDLGEKVRTWILRPGTYKIFGVGQSFNTKKNFLTVRLLPGEYVSYLLVQDEKNDNIVGGGAIQLDAREKITSNWKYGMDIGGGIDFNIVDDRKNDSLQNEIDLSMLLNFRINYKKNVIDWDTRLKLDETVSISDFKFSTINSDVDELLLTSILTIKFLQWFGPYGRVEFGTELIPEVVRRSKAVDELDTLSHYFLFYDNLSDTSNISDANPPDKIDSTSESFQTQPPLSPVRLETGLGGNLLVLQKRLIQSRLLVGIGITYERHRDEYHVFNDDKLNIDENSTLYTNYIDDKLHTIIAPKEKDRLEVGPEILLSTTLRLGKIATLEGEFKYFAPFDRFYTPDFYVRSLLSWRLVKAVTLDYEFKYTLVRPFEEELRQDESRHRILIRFSFSSR